MVARHELSRDRRLRKACLLQVPAAVLLNHLCVLGQCTLVLREQGLSLAKETHFGLFIASAPHGNLLRDGLSFLEIDPATGPRFHLLEDPEDRCPLLSISTPGQPIDVTIRLEGQRWDSPLLQELMQHWNAIAVDPAGSWAHGAGAWLDDWARTPPPVDVEPLRREVQRRLESCRVLEVVVNAGVHHALTAFTPAFFDTEGSVIRVADARRENVVFADIADAAFRMEIRSPSHISIRRESGQGHAGVALAEKKSAA